VSQHTPGPWQIEPPDPDSLNAGSLILAHGGKTVVAEILQPLTDEEGPYRGHYDALLIQAAPDLLSVCKAAVEYLCHDVDLEDRAGRVDGPARTLQAVLLHTIAKAQGGAL